MPDMQRPFEKNNDYSEDLRSMKSEFDYKQKRKFVDILGQTKNGLHKMGKQ